MQSHIVSSWQKVHDLIYNNNYQDVKVLYLSNSIGTYICKRCGKASCVGRMEVRKNVSTQYSMGVCKNCFDRE
jgi:hypothetical protein